MADVLDVRVPGPLAPHTRPPRPVDPVTLEQLGIDSRGVLLLGDVPRDVKPVAVRKVAAGDLLHETLHTRRDTPILHGCALPPMNADAVRDRRKMRLFAGHNREARSLCAEPPSAKRITALPTGFPSRQRAIHSCCARPTNDSHSTHVECPSPFCSHRTAPLPRSSRVAAYASDQEGRWTVHQPHQSSRDCSRRCFRRLIAPGTTRNARTSHHCLAAASLGSRPLLLAAHSLTVGFETPG